MVRKSLFSKNRKSQKGYSTILVMMLVPVTLILVYSLANLAIISRRQVVINKNLISYATLLDAAIDYTNYAIKNRWCMTDSWTSDSVNCDIRHPRSLERMTLDSDAIGALRDIYIGEPGLAGGIDLTQITGSIDANNVPTAHPLGEIILSLKETQGYSNIGSINVTVRRVDSRVVPQRGRETHLEVVASIVSTSPIFRGLSAVSAKSRIIVHPRELNYFSLIVANNMYVDRPSYGNTPGDFYIPTGGAGAAGINFQSPVFVNGNLVVPQDGSGAISPVRFSKRLVLGGSAPGRPGGQLMTAVGPLRPRTNGAPEDQVYATRTGFSGLLKGVDIDGTRDLGLDVLAGLSAGAAPAAGNYESCRAINRMRSDLSGTAQSDLLIQQISPPVLTGTRDTYTYRLALNQQNYFLDQTVIPYFKQYRRRGQLSTNVGSTILWMNARVGNPSPLPSPTPNPLPTDSENTFTMNRDMDVSLRFADGANPPTLSIVTRPVLNQDGDRSPEFVDLEISASGNKSAIPSPIVLQFKAFDVGTFAGRDRRTNGNGGLNGDHSRSGRLRFTISGGQLTPNMTVPIPMAPDYIKANPDSTSPILDQPIAATSSLQSLINLCETDNINNTATANSFRPVSWDTSFLPSTRFSWYFRPTAEVPGGYASNPAGGPALVIGNADGTNLPTATGFSVYSIAPQCTIPASTTLVAGFFVCDELIIAGRSSPLNIIGTFIVGRGYIDSSAANAGVFFKSIYHPEATTLLRAGYDGDPNKAILKTFDNTPCPAISTAPVWWPDLNERDYYSLRNCNTVSLRDKANPFTWTTVDPDCGIVGTNPDVRCKKRATRLLLREISRESDLQ